MVIDNAIEHLYWVAKQKSISIEFSTDEEWPLNMAPDLIERMFINLLENAIKYCPAGSIVTVSLRNEKVQGELKTICRLADNGPGVPASALPFLFDRFSQVNKDSRNSGVGLGLRFVKVVMARHHGDIRAFNVASGGTCFELTF